MIALLDAAGKGDATRIAAILDEHSDLINQRGRLPANTGLRTALHFGVGHEAIVRTLLDRGADPNIRDEGDAAYPIHFAAERGDLPIVKLLIDTMGLTIQVDSKPGAGSTFSFNLPIAELDDIAMDRAQTVV